MTPNVAPNSANNSARTPSRKLATPLEALNQLIEDSNRIVLARFKTANYDGFDLVNALLAANLKLNPFVLWLVNKRQATRGGFLPGPHPRRYPC